MLSEMSLRESSRGLNDGCVLEAWVKYAQPVSDLVSSVENGARRFDRLEGRGGYAVAMYGNLIFV